MTRIDFFSFDSCIRVHPELLNILKQSIDKKIHTRICLGWEISSFLNDTKFQDWTILAKGKIFGHHPQKFKK